MLQKISLLILLSTFTCCLPSNAQKKYGYAIIQIRCGKQDPQRNRVYYSPIIELNSLNFEQYTEGIDTSIPTYSVRYYNYAIAKWFEEHLKRQYRIAINDPEKYERGATMVVYNREGECNADKTSLGCFFTNKDQLAAQRKTAIGESKLESNSGNICEVIEL